jgi:hypothetical protein
MKIRFFYLDISSCEKSFHPASKSIFRASEILEAPISIKKLYSKYLLSTIESDFSENMFGDYDKLLKEIDELEEGKKLVLFLNVMGLRITSALIPLPLNTPFLAFALTGHSGLAHFRTTK